MIKSNTSPSINHSNGELSDHKPSSHQMSHSTSSFNVSGLKEIPKLSSGNLVSWKQGLKVHLKMNGLYGFIEKSIDRPLSTPDCDTFDMRQDAVLHAIRSTVDESN